MNFRKDARREMMKIPANISSKSLTWDQYLSENMTWEFGNVAWISSNRLSVFATLKFRHPETKKPRNQSSLKLWNFLNLQLRESPYLSTYQFPPLHRPPLGCLFSAFINTLVQWFAYVSCCARLNVRSHIRISREFSRPCLKHVHCRKIVPQFSGPLNYNTYSGWHINIATCSNQVELGNC